MAVWLLLFPADGDERSRTREHHEQHREAQELEPHVRGRSCHRLDHVHDEDQVQEVQHHAIFPHDVAVGREAYRVGDHDSRADPPLERHLANAPPAQQILVRVRDRQGELEPMAMETNSALSPSASLSPCEWIR